MHLLSITLKSFLLALILLDPFAQKKSKDLVHFFSYGVNSNRS